MNELIPCLFLQQLLNNNCTQSAITTLSCDYNWLCDAIPNTTRVCKQDLLGKYHTGCLPCTTVCPVNYFLSGQCDTLHYTQCIPCQSVTCTSGYYFGGCSGNQDRKCLPCKSCPTGYYNKNCSPSGTFPGDCVPCTSCGEFGMSGGCSGNTDSICAGGGFCNASIPCPTLVCSYQTSVNPTCDLRWTDSIDPFFLCKISNSSGTCQRCPKGWRKAGDYCVPCPDGFSCDETGVIACRGMCVTGFWGTCDFTLGTGLGTVTCHPCLSNWTQKILANSYVTRGGLLNNPEMCHIYPQCNKGYVLNFKIFNEIECTPCIIPEPLAMQSWQFFSYGITFGDVYSCMYEKLPLPNTSSNLLGFYNSKLSEFRSCPLGTTSIPFRALTEQDCIACTNLPVSNARFISEKQNCDFQCMAGTVKLGHVCFDPSYVLCNQTMPGYNVFEKENKKCVVTMLPWNSPGYSLPSLSDRSLLLSIFPNLFVLSHKFGRFAIDKDYIYKDMKNTFCRRSLSDQSLLQDIPLTCTDCTVFSKQNYDYYLIHTNAHSPYLFAFLERKHGYNNRFVMWKIMKEDGLTEGAVVGHWRMPGRVCSCDSDFDQMNNLEILYLAFCNTSWISFLNVSDSFALPLVVKGQNRILVGKRTEILTGSYKTGNQDGLRDEALFQNKLWLATTNIKNHIFVADELNCRIVEISIDYPGSFLTHVQTIGKATCYDAFGAALSFPRLLTGILNNSFFLFLTNDGVFQIDVLTRNPLKIITRQSLPQNIHQIYTFNDQYQFIIITNQTHVYNYSLLTYPCNSGEVSKPGQFCSQCPSNFYVDDQNPSRCLQCSTIEPSDCNPGYIFQPCTSVSDNKCVACPPLPGSVNAIYKTPNSCSLDSVAWLPPCPKNFFYANNSKYCIACPQLSFTLLEGATHISNCSCYGNGTLNKTSSLCENVSLPKSVSTIIPQWLLPFKFTCSASQGTVLTKINPIQCSPCPDNFIAHSSRLWCEECKNGQKPNKFKNLCICTQESSSFYNDSPYHECMCPEGSYSNFSTTCIPCDLKSIQPHPTRLDTPQPCTPCPAGYIADETNTICVACPFGFFRTDHLLQCTKCAEPHSFAPDATSSSCTTCTTECPPGFLWSQCPTEPVGWFTCTTCPAVPANAHLLLNLTNPTCSWECDSNYFYSLDTKNCTKCQSLPSCEAGFIYSPCTAYADSNCDIKCNNATFPPQNAFYVKECEWQCLPGYSLIHNLNTFYTCEYENI